MDGRGRAGLGHRLVAAWARVRAAFGDGWCVSCQTAVLRRDLYSCFLTSVALARHDSATPTADLVHAQRDQLGGDAHVAHLLPRAGAARRVRPRDDISVLHWCGFGFGFGSSSGSGSGSGSGVGSCTVRKERRRAASAGTAGRGTGQRWRVASRRGAARRGVERRGMAGLCRSLVTCGGATRRGASARAGRGHVQPALRARLEGGSRRLGG